MSNFSTSDESGQSEDSKCVRPQASRSNAFSASVRRSGPSAFFTADREVLPQGGIYFFPLIKCYLCGSDRGKSTSRTSYRICPCQVVHAVRPTVANWFTSTPETVEQTRTYKAKKDKRKALKLASGSQTNPKTRLELSPSLLGGARVLFLVFDI